VTDAGVTELQKALPNLTIDLNYCGSLH